MQVQILKSRKTKRRNIRNHRLTENEDDRFISDILSIRPPPYNMVQVQGPQNAPDPVAGGDGAPRNQGSVGGVVNQEPVVQLPLQPPPPQPSAPPQPQTETVRPESTALFLYMCRLIKVHLPHLVSCNLSDQFRLM